MKYNNEYVNNLTKKYRGELFETSDIDISKIDSLIEDDDLKLIIRLNNVDICELINQNPIDKEAIRKLFVANVNFYRLAKKRNISVPGASFLMMIASKIDYDLDKLYDELTVGVHNRPYKKR